MGQDNGGKARSFPAVPGVPIVGQPITLIGMSIPINVTFHCNCGGNHPPVEIVMSQPGQCPGCGKIFIVTFAPPPGGNLNIAVQQVPEQVPT